MQTLQRALKENHHLKHHGRLQYGLFLKGVGLSLEEAMRFWKTEFLQAPGMDGEKVMHVALFEPIVQCSNVWSRQ
jgi:DNA primase large subunit